MTTSTDILLALINAIVAGDAVAATQQLASAPSLAKAAFEAGATRQSSQPWFIPQIHRYIYPGDTALHIAAAAYHVQIINMLIEAGADVHAKNRQGDQPLHAASVGSPGSDTWNPSAQAAVIACLIKAGADPNAANKLGAAPIHKAVRTRCAAAVQTLLQHGADPARRNKSGSTAISLATLNTGRGGTGSEAAKSQQQEIIRMLDQHMQQATRSVM